MKKISLLALPLALLGAVFFLGGCGYQTANQGTAPQGSSNPKTSPATTPATNSAETTPSPAANQPSGAVTIQNFAFSPADLKIKKGDTVTWTNEDSAPHQIASDTTGKFQGPSISKGQTYSFTFNDTGTFPYHCVIHPMMKATITVE
jgi:amicyanin